MDEEAQQPSPPAWVLQLFIAFLVLFTAAGALADEVQSDKQALLWLQGNYSSSNGSGIFADWIHTDDSPCSWSGVWCDKSGRVERFNMSNGGLQGPVPPQLSSFMPRLHLLDLSNNNFTGDIPDSIFRAGCRRLRSLVIVSSNVSGPLPPSLISRCRNLQLLDLSYNRLGGPVPQPLLNVCGRLRSINLNNNQFGGTLPPINVSCNPVTELHLSGNNFVGPLPDGLDLLHNLTLLSLKHNRLSGFLTPSLGRMRSLTTLALGWNSFQGSIPPELGNLSGLRYLFANNNSLKGEIPKELVGLTSLLMLDLSANSLWGTIPVELCGLSSLKLLILANNSLAGAIPPEIERLSSMQILDLSFNRLSGAIPPAVGMLQRLFGLILSNNRLSGSVTEQIGNCSTLRFICAGSNRLSGSLTNRIYGIGHYSGRTLRNNINSNLISPEFGQCEALVRLTATSVYLKFLDPLRECRRSWKTMLMDLNKDDTDFPTETWGAPTYIGMSLNFLSGQIPEPPCQVTAVNRINLSFNRFSGGIPSSLLRLKGLEALHVRGNVLTGQLPPELGKFPSSLVVLDVAYNNLTGIIPESLQSLPLMFRVFNVSYNPGLSGTVLLSSSFVQLTKDNYLGCPNLCLKYRPEDTEFRKPRAMALPGPPSPAPAESEDEEEEEKEETAMVEKDKGRWAEPHVVMLIIAGLVPLQIAGAWAVLWIVHCRRRLRLHREWESSPSGVGFQASASVGFKYTEVAEATGFFDERQVVGRSGYSLIYRGQLRSRGMGSVEVAVKRLMQGDGCPERDFMAEFEALFGVTHPNVVPLLAVFTHGSELLLVYKFMPNGSLDQCLHGLVPAPLLANFGFRARIAVDAARGLAFLHACRPAVIHRDIKASNVLLDRHFRAVITDFGLARMLSSNGSHVSTMLAGTPGYVPPEYSTRWQITAAGDVFSFGIVLWELATGRKPVDEAIAESEGLCMLDRARLAYARDRAAVIADPALIGGDGVVQMMKVAYVCTHDAPQMRPSMQQVVSMLDTISQAFPAPD